MIVCQLDLASFKSIREFANLIIETEPKIDIFVHNAAISLKWGMKERFVSEDGLDLTMASNHYGMFLLTNLLMDHLIKMNNKCRMIVVTSKLHEYSRLNPDDDMTLNPVGVGHKYLYSNSKFANILFTIELSKRLKAAGVTNLTVNCVHPGPVETEMWNNFSVAIRWMITPFLKTIYQGIQTILYCALSPNLDEISGKYFVDCKQGKPHTSVNNVKWQEKLWGKSLKTVKLTADDPKI